MAFLVQGDGSIVPGGNSYSSVAEFRAYLVDRGISTTGYSDSVVQAALVEATDYLDNTYPWVGRRTTDDFNRTGWPRYSATVGAGSARYREGFTIPENQIPHAVKEAVWWLALARLESSLPLRERRQRSNRTLKRKKVGPIEKEWVNPQALDRFPAAEACLAGLWEAPVGGARLVRWR